MHPPVEFLDPAQRFLSPTNTIPLTPIAIMPVATSVPSESVQQNGCVHESKSNCNLSSKSPSAPPLTDLYSSSGEAKKDSALELKKDILKGLKGYDNHLVPGNVNSQEDIQFKFKR